jgi:hypothetical protein
MTCHAMAKEIWGHGSFLEPRVVLSESTKGIGFCMVLIYYSFPAIEIVSTESEQAMR